MEDKQAQRSGLTRRAFIGIAVGLAATPLVIAGEDRPDIQILGGGSGVRICLGLVCKEITRVTVGHAAATFSMQGENTFEPMVVIQSPRGLDELNAMQLTLRFSKAATGWMLSATTKGWPRSGEIAFPGVPATDWLGGNAELSASVSSQSGIRRVLRRLGVSSPASAVSLALDSDMTWRLEAGGAFRALDGLTTLSSLRLRRLLPGRVLFEGETEGSAPEVGSILLKATASQSGARWARSRKGRNTVTVTGPGSGIFTSQNWDDRKYRVSRLDAAGDTELDVLAGSQSEGTFRGDRLRLEEREVAAADGGIRKWRQIRQQLKTGFFALSSGAGRLSVAGLEHNEDEFVSGVDVTLDARSVAIVDFAGRLRVQDASLSVHGADYSRLDLGGIELSVALDGASSVVAGKQLVLGAARITVSLDKSTLRIVRAADLVSLKYAFVGVDLSVADRTVTLRPDISADQSVMVVSLPPQHVAERAYFRQVEGGAPGDYPEPDDARFKRFADLYAQVSGLVYQGRSSLLVPQHFMHAREALLLHDQEAPGFEDFREITEARISGGSRLAFDVAKARGDERPVTIGYSVSELTNWRRFDLKVVKRASSVRDGTVKSALEAAGIASVPGQDHVSLSHRMVQVVDSLTPPDDHQTSIELPFRLMLSPDQYATWRTPHAVPASIGSNTAQHPVPLWSAELGEDAAYSSVRAIWSDDFRPATFLTTRSDVGVPQPPRGPYAPWLMTETTSQNDLTEGAAWMTKLPFRATLDAFDRHELVGLSSVHGLPVLPRLVDGALVDGALASAALADGTRAGPSQISAPPGYLIDDLLDQDSPQAIYVPEPLGVREMTLTTLGGSLDVSTTFEPPAPALGKDWANQPFPAFNIDRWRQRTALGRDLMAEVVYKGFLFPLGLRVSLVKLTERKFYWNKAINAPSAFLIQRMMLTCIKPEKVFPVLGQPLFGRAWPGRQIRLITTRTPDILDPWADLNFDTKLGETQNGLIKLTGPKDPAEDDGAWLPGAVFWPRTRPGVGGEVRFQVQFDGDARAVEWPMIFVDNTAAHRPETIAALVDYYNFTLRDRIKPDLPRDLIDDITEDVTDDESAARKDRVEIDHRGAARSFAAERSPGDTTFVTHRWRLTASGSNGASGFAMTPEMEGLDQPPFYPALSWAEVSLTQVEQLTGRAPPLVRARFEDTYLHNGFDVDGSGTNPMTVYLRLHPHDTEVNFAKTGSGNRVGGLAQPNFQASLISRTNGLMGHTSRPAKPAPPRPEEHGKPYKDDAFKPPGANETLPAFGNLATLIGGKVFGIPIVSLIGDGALSAMDAPKVKEVVDVTTDAAEPLLSALGDVVGEVTLALHSIDERLVELYPDLRNGLRDLELAIADGKVVAGGEDNGDKSALVAALARVYEQGHRVIQAFERVAEDPLAPIRDALRRRFDELNDMLLQGISEELDQVKSTLTGLAIPSIAAWRTEVEAMLVAGAVDELVRPAVMSSLEAIGARAVRLNQTIDSSITNLDTLIGSLGAQLQGVMAELVDQADQAGDQLVTLCGEAVRGLVGAVAATGIDASGLDRFRIELTQIRIDLVDALDRLEAVGTSVSNPPKAFGDWLDATLEALREAIDSDVAEVIDAIDDLGAELEPLVVAAQPACSLEALTSADIEHAMASKRAVLDRIANLPNIPDRLLTLTQLAGKASLAPEFGDIRREVDEALWAAAILRAKLVEVSSILGSGSIADGTAFEAIRDLIDAAQGGGVQAGAAILGHINALRNAGTQLSAALLTEPPTDVQEAARRLNNAEVRAQLLLRAEQQSFVVRIQELIVRAGRMVNTFLLETLALVERPLSFVVAFNELVITRRNEVWNTLWDASKQPDQDPLSNVAKTLLMTLSQDGCAFLVRGDAPPMGADCVALFDADKRIRTGEDGDDLARETVRLKGLLALIRSPDPDAVTKIRNILAAPDMRLLFDGTSQRGLAAGRLIKQLLQTLGGVLRADISKLVQVDAITRRFKDELRQMHPLRKRFIYDLKTELKNFGEIFLIESRPDNLVISATTEINLLEAGQPKVSVSGKLSPFRIHLFGDQLDIVTIKFKETSFVSENGSKPDFKLTVSGVELGKVVEFIQELQSYMGYQDGGFYIAVSLLPPHVEAGYTLNLGTISIGTVSFINVSVSASVILPFDERKPEFKASLSTRDAPFLISAAPYGGGGYVALIADSEGIVGFEASFEYGGVAAFSYGPLTAIGRLTTGVFVAKRAHEVIIEGFFFAGGSGRIACFGFSSSFLLSLRQVNGAMTGEAVYTFSFRIGFAKFGFRITVWKVEGKGFSSASATDIPTLGQSYQVALAGNAAGMGSVDGVTHFTHGVSLGKDWRTYRSYFDPRLTSRRSRR